MIGWKSDDPDLAHRKHYWPRRCGPLRKKPGGCLRGLRGPPETPDWTRCSTAGRQRSPSAARSPETGGEASLRSGRSDAACATSQLQSRET